MNIIIPYSIIIIKQNVEYTDAYNIFFPSLTSRALSPYHLPQSQTSPEYADQLFNSIPILFVKYLIVAFVLHNYRQTW